MEDGYNNNYQFDLQWKSGQTSTRRSFFKFILKTLCYQVVNILRIWTSFRHELAKSNARLNFLIACRQEDLIPSHITNAKKRPFSFHSESSQQSYSLSLKTHAKKLLKFEINDLFVHITHCKKSLNALSVVMDNLNLDSTIFNKFREFTEIKSFKIHLNITRRLEKKFHSLRKKECIMHCHTLQGSGQKCAGNYSE